MADEITKTTGDARRPVKIEISQTRRGPGGGSSGFSSPQNRTGRPNFERHRGSYVPEKRVEEFQEKTLDVRRVTRVVAGGKRFRFRVTLVVGDLKGRVGVGIAKGVDVAAAIGKAKVNAKKNIFHVPIAGTTIPHEVEAKFSAARIRLKPAIEGHGLRAGGAARLVLSLAGIKDIVAKALGRTPNKLTNALATIAALKKLKSNRLAPLIKSASCNPTN